MNVDNFSYAVESKLCSGALATCMHRGAWVRPRPQGPEGSQASLVFCFSKLEHVSDYLSEKINFSVSISFSKFKFLAQNESNEKADAFP